MKLCRFLLLSVFVSFGSRAFATACTAHLESSHVEIVSEEVIEEVMVLEAQQIDLGFLVGLVLPPGYAKNEQEFRDSRRRAIEDLWPQIIELRAAMGSLEDFKDALYRIAKRYDQTDDPKKKAASLYTMVKMFSIPNERHYMTLIEDGSFSTDLRAKLSRALRRIFKLDPTWMGPLRNSMQKGGITFGGG